AKLAEPGLVDFRRVPAFGGIGPVRHWLKPPLPPDTSSEADPDLLNPVLDRDIDDAGLRRERDDTDVAVPLEIRAPDLRWIRVPRTKPERLLEIPGRQLGSP